MSWPTFEVIADDANENLVSVDGASLNGVLSFSDVPTGAALNFSGCQADLYLYSGNGTLYQRLTSSGTSGGLLVESAGSGTISFDKATGGPAAGTWPMLLELTYSDGVKTPILGPSLFKVLSRAGGTP